ncbi:MAG: hypothetical protein IMZ44_20785 [Planctomycetes bacterium]|nr:hypothetical protein [Planctomycetota bacterium]
MTEEPNAPHTPGGAAHLPQPGRQTWPLVLLGLVILVCGTAIGGGAAVLWLKDRLAGPPRPDRATPEIVRDLRSRYDLTEEQARRVGGIMQHRMEALEAIRRDAEEKFEAEHEKLRGEMKAVLTPEQYEQWVAHFDSLRRRPPGPPPGGPGRPPTKGRPGPDTGGRVQPGRPPRPGQGPPPGQDPAPAGQGPGPGRPGPGPRVPGGPPPRPDRAPADRPPGQ